MQLLSGKRKQTFNSSQSEVKLPAQSGSAPEGLNVSLRGTEGGSVC